MVTRKISYFVIALIFFCAVFSIPGRVFADKTDPAFQVITETIKSGMEQAVGENKSSFSKFIMTASASSNKEAYFEVLRRWNSYTPVTAENHFSSKGGGYFIRTRDNGASLPAKGIVIDPGFNFIDNFKGAGHFLNEIDLIIITHEHSDHTADLESLLAFLALYNDYARSIASGPSKNSAVRPKTVDLYLTLSVFKKFSGFFDISSDKDYNIHIIKKGDNIKLARDANNDASIEIIDARQQGPFSDKYATGLVFSYGDTALIYTGDAGWNKTTENEYKSVAERYKGKQRILVANIGEFSSKEKDYLTLSDKGLAYDDEHLGRLGLARAIETIMPKITVIADLGEELKSFRLLLAGIYQKAFNDKTIVLPADIGLKLNMENGNVAAITDIKDERYVYNYITPSEVALMACKRDDSLHYFKREVRVKRLLTGFSGHAFDICVTN